MSIAMAGYFSGYNGSFPFDKPGDQYGDNPYVGMRLVSYLKCHYDGNVCFSFPLFFNANVCNRLRQMQTAVN